MLQKLGSINLLRIFMIIFNDTEAFEVSSIANIEEEFRSHSIESQQLPYVQLQRGKDGSLYCKIGYVSIDGIHPEENEDMQIGHVVIRRIDVSQEIHKENIRISNKYYISYHYSIKIYLTHDYQNRYEFHSTDRVTYENGRIISKSNKSIISFFTYIVPQINNAIDSGILPSELNMDYYYQKYKDGGREYASYETSPYSINLDYTLDLIYSLQVRIENSKPHTYSNDDVTCYATFDGREGIIYNAYIAHLFAKIIKASISKHRGNNQNIIYSAKLHELPNYLKYDAESLRRYILRKLYIGILLNYEQVKAEEGFCYCGNNIGDCKDIEQNEAIRSVLNFILGIKATCYEDGENRVGRDDRGWTEYTILFPIEYGFEPSKFMLELINSTLDVKLERQDENLCYYYRRKTKAEYIAGMAWRRDCGSYKLQRNYLHRLLKKIVPMISSRDDLDKLLENSNKSFTSKNSQA